jgi:hypothetical protein
LSKQRTRKVFLRLTCVGCVVGVGDHGHQRKAVVVVDNVVVVVMIDVVLINSSSDDSANEKIKRREKEIFEQIPGSCKHVQSSTGK